MSKHKVTLTLTATWTHVVTVDLDDGCTEEEACAALATAISLTDLSSELGEDDIEVDDEDWQTSPVFAAPAPVDPAVPYGAWLDHGGRKWATNGYVIIRDDCPLPDASAATGEGGELRFEPWIIWLESGQAADRGTRQSDVRDLITRKSGQDSEPPAGRYAPVYAPLLRAGSVSCVARGRGYLAIVRDDSWEPIAFVMSASSDYFGGIRIDEATNGAACRP